MGITGSIIVYVLIWWIIFFSVLPVGIQSNKEKFKERIGGIDPGAPNNPKIAKIFLNIRIIKNYLKDHRVFMTSVVAALSFGGSWNIANKDSVNTSFTNFLKIINDIKK